MALRALPPMKMFLGGLVSEDDAGRVLAALFRARAERLDCSPLLEEAPAPGIKHERVKLIPPMEMANGKAPRGLLIKMTEAAMQESGRPMSPAELRTKLTEQGFPGGNPNVSSALENLCKQKKAVRTKGGLYVLKTQRKAKAKAKAKKNGAAKKSGETAKDFVLAALAKADAPLAMKNMQKRGQARGHTEGAIATSTMNLHKTGAITRVSPGLYAMKQGA